MRVMAMGEEASKKPLTLFREPKDAAVLFERAFRLDRDESTHELAERLYREVVRLTPDHAEAWNNLGVMAYRRKRFDVALDAWSRALLVDSHFAEAHNNIGHLFQQEGKLEIASVYLLRAVENAPDMEEARFNLALCLQALGRPKAALRHWRQYLRRWPRSEFSGLARKHVGLCRRAATG